MQLEFDAQALMEAAALAENWVARTTGDFSAFIFGKENGLENPELRDQVIDDLLRRGVVEATGTKHNQFRRVDNDCPPIDWLNYDEDRYPLRLPLFLDRMAHVAPANVVIIAGDTNSGKSTWVHNILRSNLASMGGQHWGIDLFLSEAIAELKPRLLGMNPDQRAWDGLRVRARRDAYEHVVNPHGLNVIDYLKVHGDFWKVAERIEAIENRLETGVAVITMQKKRGELLPRGGDLAIEACRLALSLSYDPETHTRTCKVIKCKLPVDHTNHPEGQEIDYDIAPDGTIRAINGWEFVDDDKRKKRKEAAKAERQQAFNKQRGFKFGDDDGDGNA